MSTTPPAPLAPSSNALHTITSSPPSPTSMSKKRRVERRKRLRKSALCKHFDKPGGCSFLNCKFAHGRVEMNDADSHSVAAQRKLIREQAVHRAEEQFQTSDSGDTSQRRGTMIERYYTELFSCDTMGKSMEDQYVHMHSNRLCVIGVAESHPVMQEELVSVEFAQNVLESRVTGKKKKGGCFMLPSTVIGVLKCKSDREFKLYSCIRGSLIEVNECLQKEPELLKQKHQSNGYLIIIQPKKVEVAEIQESLLSKDEYHQYRAISRAKVELLETTTESASTETTKLAKEDPKSEVVDMEE